jgi:hypothetical protein
MRVHALLHRHATAGTLTKRKRVDEPPQAGRLHRGLPRTIATTTTHNEVRRPLMANRLAATRVSHRMVRQ